MTSEDPENLYCSHPEEILRKWALNKIYKKKVRSLVRDSNTRPSDYKSLALPG